MILKNWSGSQFDKWADDQTGFESCTNFSSTILQFFLRKSRASRSFHTILGADGRPCERQRHFKHGEVIYDLSHGLRHQLHSRRIVSQMRAMNTLETLD